MSLLESVDFEIPGVCLTAGDVFDILHGIFSEGVFQLESKDGLKTYVGRGMLKRRTSIAGLRRSQRGIFPPGSVFKVTPSGQTRVYEHVNYRPYRVKGPWLLTTCKPKDLQDDGAGLKWLSGLMTIANRAGAKRHDQARTSIILGLSAEDTATAETTLSGYFRVKKMSGESALKDMSEVYKIFPRRTCDVIMVVASESTIGQYIIFGELLKKGRVFDPLSTAKWQRPKAVNNTIELIIIMVDAGIPPERIERARGKTRQGIDIYEVSGGALSLRAPVVVDSPVLTVREELVG